MRKSLPFPRSLEPKFGNRQH
nr:hypothetical protein 1 (cpc-1 5' region) - Neurospora crassa [Neurospora crassa]